MVNKITPFFLTGEETLSRVFSVKIIPEASVDEFQEISKSTKADDFSYLAYHK